MKPDPQYPSTDETARPSSTRKTMALESAQSPAFRETIAEPRRALVAPATGLALTGVGMAMTLASMQRSLPPSTLAPALRGLAGARKAPAPCRGGCVRVLASLLALSGVLLTGSVQAAEDGPLPASPAPGLNPAPAGDERVVDLNEKGSALYAAGDYRRAVELFIQAYAVDEDPNLLFNIASCYEGLGDLEAATEKYRAFLEAPHADPAGRPRAERAIERLARAMAPVTREPSAEPKPAAAPSVTAPPAGTADDGGPPTWAAWVGLGGGVALGAAGATLYLLGAADHAEVTDARGYDDSEAVVTMTRARADDLVRSGDTKKAVGVGAAATGAALMTGYLVWWLLDRTPDEQPAAHVAVDGSAASFSVSGSF